jgi:hypothetical protein
MPDYFLAMELITCNNAETIGNQASLVMQNLNGSNTIVNASPESNEFSTCVSGS